MKTLWLQQLQKQKEIEIRKQPGEENGAGIGTQIPESSRLIKCMERLNMKGEILNTGAPAVARTDAEKSGAI